MGSYRLKDCGDVQRQGGVCRFRFSRACSLQRSDISLCSLALSFRESLQRAGFCNPDALTFSRTDLSHASSPGHLCACVCVCVCASSAEPGAQGGEEPQGVAVHRGRSLAPLTQRGWSCQHTVADRPAGRPGLPPPVACPGGGGATLRRRGWPPIGQGR